MWLFHPKVQALYSMNKVFVKVASKDRSGFVEGLGIFEHGNCDRSHSECRVNIIIEYYRTSPSTLVKVSDIEPCHAVKKGDLVAQILGIPALVGRTMKVTGIPKRYSGPKPFTVLTDDKITMDIVATFVTKVEGLDKGPYIDFATSERSTRLD